jgi:hypothetical protein
MREGMLQHLLMQDCEWGRHEDRSALFLIVTMLVDGDDKCPPERLIMNFQYPNLRIFQLVPSTTPRCLSLLLNWSVKGSPPCKLLPDGLERQLRYLPLATTYQTRLFLIFINVLWITPVLRWRGCC